MQANDASASPSNSLHSQGLPFVRKPAQPGLLEKQGVGYFRRFAKTLQSTLPPPEDLLPDAVYRNETLKILLWATSAAFAAGAITTMGSVWVELEFEQHLPWYSYYSLQGSVTMLMLGLEFIALFYIALKMVAAQARLTQHTDQAEEPLLPGEDNIPNLLARAALEVPDPVFQVLGIDPLRHVSKRRALLVGLLYKAKVFLTSTVARFVIRRAMGKGGARIASAWVAVPITGLWNAIVLWRVSRETRLRLVGHRVAQFVAQEILTPEKLTQLSPAGQTATLEAVGNVIVLTQNSHPNMLLLLAHLYYTLHPDPAGDYADWDRFRARYAGLSAHEQHLVRCLLVVATAFDGKLTHLERKHLQELLGAAFAAHIDNIQQLSSQLRKGELHAAMARIRQQFAHIT